MSGCGVGKDLLLDFVPDASRSAGVVSTVLEALYGEQRKQREAEKTAALKAAADKAAAEQVARQAEQEAAAARRKAQEAEAAALKRQAEQKAADEAAQRKAEQEAKEAEKRAEKAREEEALAAKKADQATERQKKAEEEAKAHDLAVKRAARDFGVDINILRSFSSPTAMAEFAGLVKRLRIPADKHVACAEKCLTEEWSKMTMREKIPAWWYEASGEMGRHYKRMEEVAQKAAQQRRYVGGDLPGYIMRFERNVKDAMIEAKTVAENIQYAEPVLRKNVAANLKGVVALLQAVIEAAESVDHQQEKVIIDQQSMLPHHNQGG